MVSFVLGTAEVESTPSPLGTETLVSKQRLLRPTGRRSDKVSDLCLGGVERVTNPRGFPCVRRGASYSSPGPTIPTLGFVTSYLHLRLRSHGVGWR